MFVSQYTSRVILIAHDAQTGASHLVLIEDMRMRYTTAGVFLAFPGGGENAEDAGDPIKTAIREVFEETGLVCEYARMRTLKTVRHAQSGKPLHVVRHFATVLPFEQVEKILGQIDRGEIAKKERHIRASLFPCPIHQRLFHPRQLQEFRLAEPKLYSELFR